MPVLKSINLYHHFKLNPWQVKSMILFMNFSSMKPSNNLYLNTNLNRAAIKRLLPILNQSVKAWVEKL
jgi:hypothetical protein